MTDTACPPLEDWGSDWDVHKEQQLVDASRASLREKIVWLEESHRIILRLQKQPSGGTTDPDRR
jgi:hypothetical protein